MKLRRHKQGALVLVPLDDAWLSEESRFDTYLGWLHNPEVTQFLEVRANPPTANALRRFVVDEGHNKSSALLGMTIDGVEFIGTLRLSNIDFLHQTGAIGAMIGDLRYHGMGYGSQFISMACDVARDQLHLVKLNAGIYATNIASLKSFQRAGFRSEGTLALQRKDNRERRVDEILLSRILSYAL